MITAAFPPRGDGKRILLCHLKMGMRWLITALTTIKCPPEKPGAINRDTPQSTSINRSIGSSIGKSRRTNGARD
jgi:hypothetical protein